MNENTKESLKQFAHSVMELAQGVVHLIGVDSAGEIITNCQSLIAALDKDKTIK